MDKQGTNIEKLVASLAELNQDLAKDLLIKKETKKTNKPVKERKPCGFAIPSNVSGDMCDFMGVEHGTPISRIQITKYINKYIKDNALENPENKQNIVPDDKLWKILGEEARDLRITHFTLQKHLNRHFIKADKSSSALDTEKNVMTPNV